MTTSRYQTHALWVRVSHWIATISIAILAYTGVVILMAHPRLYWGYAGNDLTPAVLELPVSPFGEEYARHAASADFPNESIRTDAASFVRDASLRAFGNESRGERHGRRVEQPSGGVDPSEQRLDFPPKLGVAAALHVEEVLPLRRLARERGIEHLLDTAHAIDIHSR